MNDELEVLKIVVKRLDEARIPYFLSGSMALGYYATPRMTRDIDIVIELKKSDIDRFAAIFEDDFYLDRTVLREEVARGGMFNLIHNERIVKVDFILRPDTFFHEKTFNRRVRAVIDHTSMWLITAEDLILAKLLWARTSRSEVQIGDVVSLLITVKELDRDYLQTWVLKLGLEEIYAIANQR